jgi:electron transfer flavoprotein beta subunit
MKILVCLGNVPDTTTKVKLVDGKPDLNNIQWVINPWDELALTRAMELKEDGSNSVDGVSVATVGLVSTEPTIRKALAIGADTAFRIDAEPSDSYFTAQQLAQVAKDFDIILTGLESADYNGMAVGQMLAEILGFASVSAVSSLNIDGDTIKVTRDIDGGKEVVSVNAPVVLTVQKGIAIDPRIPAMRGIMMARRKPLNVLQPAEAENLTEIVSYEMPQPKGACKMVDPDNVAELVELLRNDAKVI